MKRIVEYLLNCRIDGQHKHIKITDAYKLKKLIVTAFFYFIPYYILNLCTYSDCRKIYNTLYSLSISSCSLAAKSCPTLLWPKGL